MAFVDTIHLFLESVNAPILIAVIAYSTGGKHFISLTRLVTNPLIFIIPQKLDHLGLDIRLAGGNVLIAPWI